MATAASASPVHRNDTMVAARIPSGVKTQGDSILAEIGSTTTELINSAYTYLLRNRQPPIQQESDSTIQSGVHALNAEQMQRLHARKERMTSAVPSSYWRSSTYRLELEEALKEKYETLN